MLLTLPLYVLREFGKALGIALLIFSLILLGFAAGQVMQDGAGIFTILTILPNLFPLVSPMVLPLTLITATLVCFGRLAGGNEFVAVQAGGVHPAWVAAPALAVALLAATITAYLNDAVLTSATSSIEKALVRDKTMILKRQLERSGSFLFENAAISRLPRQEGQAGVDITFFASGADRGRAGTERWEAEIPHQRRRILARDHRMSLTESAEGALFVEAELKNFQQFDLAAREIRPPSAQRAFIHWPIGSEGKEWRVNINRVTYWGIGRILAERRRVRDDLERLGSALLRDDDVAAWGEFAAALLESAQREGPSPARRIWESLTPEARAAMRLAAEAAPLSGEQRNLLLRALNRLLALPTLVDDRAFRGLAWTPEGQELLRGAREDLSPSAIARLNRLALEAAFPRLIAASLPVSLDDAPKRIEAAIDQAPDFRMMSREMLKSYRKHTAELHLKLALSFSCVAFACVGIPLGLLMRRETATIGFGAGILLAGVYYVVIKSFQALVQAGVALTPWWTLWLPNLALLIISAVLWLRARRAG